MVHVDVIQFQLYFVNIFILQALLHVIVCITIATILMNMENRWVAAGITTLHEKLTHATVVHNAGSSLS